MIFNNHSTHTKNSFRYLQSTITKVISNLWWTI